MKTYAGSPWQRLDPELREALAPMDRFLREIGPAFQRISFGQNPEGSGSTIGSARVGVSSARTALTDYLYLPGLEGGVAQTVNGDVIFTGTVTLTPTLESSIDTARTWTALQTFKDTTFKVVDDADASKTLVFSLGGATANADLTLAWSGTVDRAVTIPDATTTLAGIDVAQQFTATQTFNADTPTTAAIFNLSSSGSFSGTAGLVLRDNADAFATEIQRNPGAAADNVVFLPTGADVILVGTDETTELFNKTMDSTCALDASTASTGCRFQDITTSTKRLRFVLSGAVGNNAITLTNTAARTYALGNLSGNFVIVGNDPPAVASGALGAVDLTAQTANIVTTNLSSTPPAGFYEVEVYIMTTTADVTAGTLAVVIGWTDNVGATTNTVIAAHALTATGRSTGRALVRVSSGDITYAVTITGAYGTSQYAVYVRTIFKG